jgi:hypothetical protein
LRPPASKRSVHHQPFAACGPTAQTGEVGFHSSLVNEDNAFRERRYGWCAVREPISPLLSDPGTAAFGGDQRLFFVREPQARQQISD